jgi:hypothetical protein
LFLRLKDYDVRDGRVALDGDATTDRRMDEAITGGLVLGVESW